MNPRNTRIIQMLESGVRQKQICLEMGLTKSVVGQVVYRYRRVKPSTPPAKPSLSEDRKAECLRLRADGLTDAAICERFGYGRDLLRRHIGPSPRASVQQPHRNAQIIEKLNRGVPQKRIRKEMGLSKQIVAGVAHRHRKRMAKEAPQQVFVRRGPSPITLPRLKFLERPFA